MTKKDWSYDWDLMPVGDFYRVVNGIYESNAGGNGVYHPDTKSPRIRALLHLPAFCGAAEIAVKRRSKRLYDEATRERKRELQNARNRAAQILKGVRVD